MSEEDCRQILRTDGLRGLKNYVKDNGSTLLQQPNVYGDLLLHIVAKMDLPDLFKFVYNMHPQAIEYENNNAHTPVGCSVLLGTDEAVEILRFVAEVAPENLNWVSRRNRKTLLHMAAEEGHEKIAKFLIAFLDMDKPDDHKWTALGNAIFHDRPKVVDVLLNNGADPWILQGARERDLQYIARFHDSPNSLVVLNKWNAMPEEKRDGIVEYHKKSTWQIRDHSEFPSHLRAQVLAVAVSLADMHIAPVLELIAKGIDALKRKRQLVI